ncbi:hypothetical protein WA026_017456, partial [Henosepilachna vigintioctopunctata]
MFLPPNCTALIQPMDQHIIQVVKQDYKRNLLLKAVSKDQAIEKTLKEFNMKHLLWPDIVATPTNDPQIVPSEVIEQIAAETQISSNDLETWFRGMDKEGIIFSEISDKEIIKEISIYKTINEEDDEVISTTPQVTAEDAIIAFELGLQWAEAN